MRHSRDKVIYCGQICMYIYGHIGGIKELFGIKVLRTCMHMCVRES